MKFSETVSLSVWDVVEPFLLKNNLILVKFIYTRLVLPVVDSINKQF